MTGRRVPADARRTMRFWAAAVLAGLLAALAVLLDCGDYWPAVAAAGSAAPLWLVLRNPRPTGPAPALAGRTNAAARGVLLALLACALAAFAGSRFGERQVRIPALCPGQSAQLGDWNLLLKGIDAVAGPGFTALQARLVAKRDGQPEAEPAPQLRDHFVASAAPDATVVLRLWRGDLAAGFVGYQPANGCMALAASWRPAAGLARVALWLAALAAVVMTAIAFASLAWRARARARIAMRREDRPLPGRAPVVARGPPARRTLLLLAAVAVLAVAGFLALGPPGKPQGVALAPYAGGTALIAARRSLVEGPADRNSWIVIADAMARRGNFADAAEVLQGAVASDPADAQGWLALGDALYGHAGGQLSPAAELAYARADAAQARRGAPPLVAAAMVRSGRNELAQRWLRQQSLAVPLPAAPKGREEDAP